jgi:hypothetical protein
MKIFRMLMKMILLGVIGISAQESKEITGWKMQDSAAVSASTGESIASAAFDASSWYAATVPGTVLSTLVDNDVYPDPNYGQNMVNIPDLANQQKRYWFRTTFDVAFSAGQRVWLELGGINYFATIFLNGQQVGTMFGAFKEGKFDVTSIATSGTNYLAVKIRGNYTPGSYHTKQSGQCGSNGGVMTQDGPTFIASQGWDWIPTIPDRCMGIWKPVYVRVTGPVAIRHPWIRTTDVSAASATVKLQAMLRNASAAAVSGKLTATIDGSTEFTSQTVSVPANDTLNVNFPDLAMTSPKLWWPNGYGDPNLYTCSITFTPDGEAASDTATLKFGVRQFSYTNSGTGYLILNCNGKRILCRGGNWGMDDAMKRWDPRKTGNKVRYHKEMNFNMLRDWLGMTDNEPFYSFCDQYGIMVWADFWEPHSADGPTPATDQANYLANMRDKIYRARNHASLAVWCERNETAPTAAFLTALQSYHTELDGTRFVQGSSGSGGVHSGGPYTYTSPVGAYNAITGFHTEFGGPTVPSYETMNAFLPEANQMPMGNNWWSFHDYCSGNGNPANYTNAMTTLYGSSMTIQQVCLKAQLMNYDNYRAPFEALQVKRFSGATGLLLWMSNCVWPSTMWQTYDYYMEGTGAMYGSQKGCEPVHIMYYGTGTYQISVVNNTADALSGYTASSATYNLDGTKAWSASTPVTVAADAATNVVAVTAGSSTPYFLDLKLRDGSGNLVSKNFYWVPNSGTNISAMLTMPKTTLAATANADWKRNGRENTITFNVVNTGTVCAIACRLLLTKATSGDRILPVHYNDNYFSLVPGDTQSVTIAFDEADRGTENPKLCITGVNVDQTCITIDAAPVTRRGLAIDIPEHKSFVLFSGGKLVLRGLPAGGGWRMSVTDMRGRQVMQASGTAHTSFVALPARGLRPGAYVVTVVAGSERLRALFAITGH